MMSLFPMAVLTVFYERQIGMSLLEIMVLQGAFGLAMVCFEFPSGFLADRLGYRFSLMAASLLHVVGWALYANSSTFTEIAIAEALLGVGTSLISGCDSALLYESLLESGQEARYTVWMGRFQSSGQVAEGVAALAAGALFFWWPPSVFWLEVLLWVVNFGIAYRMVEPARHRPPGSESWSQIKAIVRHAFIEAPRLRAVFLLAIILGMSTFLPVWMIQLYAVDAGVPDVWLGVIWAIANFCVALGALASNYLETRFGFARILALCAVMLLVGFGGLGFSYAIYGCAFYFVLTLMRGINGPIVSHREQRFVPSSDRAGFLSLRSLVFRLTFLVVGPLTGWLALRWGQHPTMLLLGFVFAALVLVMRQVIKSQDQAAADS